MTSSKCDSLSILQSEQASWGGSILVCGCFAAIGTGALHKVDGLMKNLLILQHNLKPLRVETWTQICVETGQ